LQQSSSREGETPQPGDGLRPLWQDSAIGAELDLVNHPGARLAGKIKTEHDPELKVLILPSWRGYVRKKRCCAHFGDEYGVEPT
jgi:hypothetical protein